MKQKCSNCSIGTNTGDKFCENCGHQLVQQTKRAKKPIVLGALIITLILITVFIGTNVLGSIKGEWVIDGNKGNLITLTIPNKKELTVSSLDSKTGSTITIFYEFEKPQSADEPYEVSTPKRAEIYMPIQSSEDMTYFSDRGFTVEKEKENYLIYANEPEAIAYLADMERKMSFYVVENMLEIIYATGDQAEFVLAVPPGSTAIDYITLFDAVIDELKVTENSADSSTTELLLEIKQLQPDSKLFIHYSKLNEQNAKYLQAIKNKDKNKLQQITENISELPLARIGGLYQNYRDKNERIIALIDQAVQLEQAIQAAQTALDEGDYIGADKHLDVRSEQVGAVEAYFPETLKSLRTLQEAIATEKYKNITLEDFYGLWTNYSAVSNSEDRMGKPLIYLSSELVISAINHGELNAARFISAEVNGKVATITAQPLHGYEPADFEPYTFDMTLEESPDQKVVVFANDPTLEFYYQENAGEFTEDYEMLEEKGKSASNHYQLRENDLALLETNPARYMLGKRTTDYVADSKIIYSFLEKNPDTNLPGIGELWYYRETDTGDGNPQTKAIQWLIQAITYADDIITVKATEYLSDTPIYFYYTYTGNGSLGVYNDDTQQITAIVTFE